ncbi:MULTISPECIES: TrmB family transcriptional regulator [Haloferax]|uniref:TrmB family transcriptional regulator n=2 Tax=Haloferax TaxID=2251 RepID=A0A6G1Z2R9_9EURY|nr:MULTISPECIES: TrmB family transcriptional regulator [Haloferax]KAB1188152.1 TrmB family transcriptional regulator [Haloferax sp. CBA1149]MRW80830.1 TrmB family transcriptional regulator [Haloferax marinisediminis]
MQQTVPKIELPGELESPSAKLVYLYLTTHDGASITELQDGLEMKKISLYSILGTLCKRGLVRQEAERYHIAH